MPYNHSRRRGATVLFRRKIPMDLRDQFGSHEIVRSIGRATPGEARRIVHRLWSQTEMVFMHVRQEPHLKREEIGRVVDAAVDALRDGIDFAISEVMPGTPLPPLDEPVDRGARLRGHAALYDALLGCNEVVDPTGGVQGLARTVLGKTVEPGGTDERRLCRAVMKAERAEIIEAAAEFDRLAARRPAAPAINILEETEYEPAPEILATLKRARSGDNVEALLARLVPIATPAPVLRNADVLCSVLWSVFIDNKIVMGEWRAPEAKTNGQTMRLWLHCCGDRSPREYSCDDVSKFHRMVKGLPSSYYRSGKYRKIYETQGALAVVEMTKDQNVVRISKLTWNNHNSIMNQFFLWCSSKGQALPKESGSIFLKESEKSRDARYDTTTIRLVQCSRKMTSAAFSVRRNSWVRSQGIIGGGRACSSSEITATGWS